MLVYKSYIWLVSFFPLALLGKQGFVSLYLIVILALFFSSSYILKQKLVNPVFLKIAALFWGVLVAVSLVSDSPLIALRKILPLSLYIGLAFVLCNTNEKEIRRKILFALLAVCIFLFIDGVVQYLTGSDLLYKRPVLIDGDYKRIYGPFKKVGFSSTIAMMALPFLVYTTSTYRKSTRVAAAVFLVLMAGIIIWSRERSGVYLFALGAILHFFYIGGWIPCIGFILTLFTLLALTPGMFERQILTLIQAAKSEYIVVWKTAIEIFKDNMLVGIGPHHFSTKFCALQKDVWFCHRHPHSVPLEILLDSGVVGFLLFAIMMYCMFRSFYKFYTNSSSNIKALFLCPVIPLLARFLLFPSNLSFTHFLYAGPWWFLIGWAGSMMNSYPPKRAHRIEKY